MFPCRLPRHSNGGRREEATWTQQWRERYSDLSRFLDAHQSAGRTRYYLLDGLDGDHPHVARVSLDPYDGGTCVGVAVLSHEEMQADPRARPLLEAWLRGDDSEAWLYDDDEAVVSDAEDILQGYGSDG